MSEKKRKVFTSAFKAKVALDALREQKTINQLTQDHNVHATQIGQWRKELQDKSSTVFDATRGPKPSETDVLEKLYAQIGRLKVEVDWLKKKLGMIGAPVFKENMAAPLGINACCPKNSILNP